MVICAVAALAVTTAEPAPNMELEPPYATTGSVVTDVQIPGIVPIAGAATVLVVAAMVASLTPAARASRVDVVRALRAE